MDHTFPRSVNTKWGDAALTLAVGAIALGAGLMASRRRRCDFHGQTVLITGGSRGLGLEMARAWGREGARIAICSRESASVAEAIGQLSRLGIEAFGSACDVRNEGECEGFVEDVRRTFGRIDVLVNNAGIIQVGPMDCMTNEDYDDAMRTHFWGPLYFINAVLPEMRSRRAGRIVNISSIGGRISVPHLLPYSASKFALVGLSEGMAAELAKDGIYVTTVTPGLMRTGSPRNARFKGHHAAEYAWFSVSDSQPLISTSSKAAAHRIIEACRRGSTSESVSLLSAVGTSLHGMLPVAMTSLLTQVCKALPGVVGGSTTEQAGWQSESQWSPSVLTALNEAAAFRNNERP
jgi:NAD(P)-dependent dehydrogenase (short-subunit alcohol dehydrogenase family)